MKIAKKIISSVLVLCVAIALFAQMNIFTANAEIQETHDYHYIEPGNEQSAMAIPKTFTVRNIVNKIDSEDPANSSLKNSTDMFIDDDDNIYILGSKPARVVKMDMWGNVSLEITEVKCKECAEANEKCTHTTKDTLKEPQGIFVFNEETGNPEADQHIYVADTGNNRIVHFDSEGYFVEEFTKPDDPAIADYPFDVKKIYINNNGIMYLLMKTDFQGFMKLSTKGEYLGNSGMTWTVTSVTDIIASWFSVGNELIERAALTAPPYSNFMMDDSGWMYATVIQVDENQIAKLNTSGVNVYPEAQYGRNFFEITDDTTYRGTTYTSNFVDIAVDKQGIIYVLDDAIGNVFLYDQEGNNLAYFGSSGSYRGHFKEPVAIGLLSDSSVVVLDQGTGYVTIFKPTEFCTLMKDGTELYYDAKYEEARSVWTELLEIDGNYVYGHKALGKAYFKEKNYDMAMKEYKLADNTEGYSLAFEKKKGEITKKYFFLLVLIIIVLVVGFVIGYRAVKKYIDKLHVKITTWGGDEE